MNSATTTKKDSHGPFQSTKAHHSEKLLSPEKREKFDRIKGTCAVLVQKQGVHSVNAMHAAEFYYTGNGDTARCNECELEVSGWTLDMEPFAIHAQRSPSCSYVRSILSCGIGPSPSSVDERSFRHQEIEPIQQNNQPDRLVEVNKMKQIRQRTFSHWPHRTSPSSAQMIEAGFFNCNVGDRVICLYCNIICQQWIPNIDDPWEVHKTLSPKCPYVIIMLEREQATSIVFMNEIIDNAAHHTADVIIPNCLSMKRVRWFSHREYARQLCTAELYRKTQELKPIRQESDKRYKKKHISRLVNHRLDLPVSRRLATAGFDVSIIKSCYENQLELTHDDFADDCDLQVACMILQKQIEYIDGKKENIIVPSVEMSTIHPEMSATSQDDRSEMNEQDHKNESTSTNRCHAYGTAMQDTACVPCGHSLQLC